MSKSIEISPKYGVNPVIPLCFFCGEQKNEIALMGRIRNGQRGGDFEAPKEVILDYVPCDCCKERLNNTEVLIVEVTRTPLPDGRPPISKDAYPTGRSIFVAKEAVSLEGNTFLMVDSEFESMFGGAKD